jgi:hypothetical protein
MRKPTAVTTTGLASICSVLVLLATASTAFAVRPNVNTTAAKSVSFGSALLTGTVNPNGSDTSYYFQFGVTRAYGSQTGILDAGGGTHNVSVSIAVGGLQPLTLYHYRLVAVNASGATLGPDRTLLTTRVPLSLQILASPNPVLFGGTVVVQGTLSGTNNANRAVVLQGAPFGSLAFVNLGNTLLTNASGGFSFPILGITGNTQFRVVTTTNPPVVSPVALESVLVKVSAHVRRTHRAHFARIYGTVTPAEDGAQVGILRIAHGRGILAGGTVLRHRNSSSSQFTRVVHVQRGVYRVLVRITNGLQTSNYSVPLLIG